MATTYRENQQLVIGLGEVGTAIQSILGCKGRDKRHVNGRFKVLHICFPCKDFFKKTVRDYQTIYEPELTIIHSTVPVGTCEQLGAVHSPIRGVHPHLEESIRTFTKYFAGPGAEDAAAIFAEKGIPVEVVASSNDTEAAKLWDTTAYGINVLIEKAIHQFCKENGLDYDFVYGKYSKTYNDGYKEMGMSHFQKYLLKHMDGKIGGHCIVQNASLLDSSIAKFLLDENSKY